MRQASTQPTTHATPLWSTWPANISILPPHILTSAVPWSASTRIRSAILLSLTIIAARYTLPHKLRRHYNPNDFSTKPNYRPAIHRVADHLVTARRACNLHTSCTCLNNPSYPPHATTAERTTPPRFCATVPHTLTHNLASYGALSTMPRVTIPSTIHILSTMRC
jgi:hypothetical protein